MGHCGFCCWLGGGSCHCGCTGSHVVPHALPSQGLPGVMQRTAHQVSAVSTQLPKLRVLS